VNVRRSDSPVFQEKLSRASINRKLLLNGWTKCRCFCSIDLNWSAVHKKIQMVHSNVHFAFEQVNSKSAIPVRDSMFEKTVKASLQILSIEILSN
jgi:hypothetical protein